MKASDQQLSDPEETPKERRLYWDYILTLVDLEQEQAREHPDLVRIGGLKAKAEADRAELEVELRLLQLIPKEDAQALKEAGMTKLRESMVDCLKRLQGELAGYDSAFDEAHPEFKARVTKQAIFKTQDEMARRIDAEEEELLAGLRARIQRAAALEYNLSEDVIAETKQQLGSH